METASRRRVHALPGARLAVRALAALLTGTLGMETAPAVPQAGRMILASEGGAQAARERLACAGTQHLVLSPEALAGVEQLDAKGQRARTDADLLAADELFLTNVIQGMRWVARFGDREYANSFAAGLFGKLEEKVLAELARPWPPR